ncbi:hypothetical protein EV586_101639 [Tumebacillus sp. BK434]|uniref:hypothetical protein n=1 Tax=Tumebacillus sp. BK434 TaxID=2512169 RepID=UPI001044BE29|nr:hypothetical protein [Tumebacillus sp. BK434]TCP59421.1 hypothetical protein EV586_101639 [Tumebacillus sp. BK434]
MGELWVYSLVATLIVCAGCIPHYMLGKLMKKFNHFRLLKREEIEQVVLHSADHDQPLDADQFLRLYNEAIYMGNLQHAPKAAQTADSILVRLQDGEQINITKRDQLFIVTRNKSDGHQVAFLTKQDRLDSMMH